MYLKSIHMYGFKSFAQKIIFKFDKGITGIVGPNGSGKSNIADAVRWVLGEQSAKLLRGNNMQDVIFAGTEARKPLGFCQVDLTIDNQDMMMPIEFSEVTVSRRVYRSGESEYSINGSSCRLKDIHELFMDTGVGKEGYSIIGQGQIDKILSTKPDDRRALFDEAAGIVKFKKRKLSAEKKLEEEKQNLTRINDIIRELESQKEHLYEQSEKAKEYLGYKEQLKKYEVNFYIHEAENIDEKIQEINSKEQILNQQLFSLKNEITQIKNKHNEFNMQIEALEEEENQQRDQNTKQILEKEKKESNIEIAKEQILSYIKANERIQDQNIELQEKQKKNSQQETEFGEKLKELLEKKQEVEVVLQKKERMLEEIVEQIQENETKIDTIQTDRIQRLNEISNVKGKIQRYQTIIENNTSRKKVIYSRKQIIEKTIETLNKELKSYQQEFEDLHSSERKNQEEKKIIGKQLQDNEEKIKEKVLEITKKKDQLQIAKSKYKALKGLSEQYEGYGFSIKKLMEYKKDHNENKLLGVVADIISVDKTYETAIEIALGGSVQNVVTEDEVAAKKMIQYLKSNRFGRATFLPLSSMKSKAYNPIKTKEKGFIGYASDIVSYDVQYKHLVNYLLGRVIVVEHIDDAMALAKKYNYTLRMVTLDGELINPGGSLTGGAYRNKGNQFLSRKRELEQFEEKIPIYKNELLSLEQQLELLQKDLDEYKKVMSEFMDKEHDLRLNINSTNLTIQQVRNDLRKHDEDLSDLSIELDQLLKQENEMNESINSLNHSLEGTQVEDDDAEHLVKQLTEEIQKQKSEKDKISSEITTIKIDLSTTNQELKNVNENSSRIEQELEELKHHLEKNATEMNENLKHIAEKEKAIQEFESNIRVIQEQAKELEDQIRGLEEKRHKLSKEQEELYKLREEKNDACALVEKDIYRLQNAKVKHEMEKENKRDYMWNEYELTLHKAYEYKDNSLGDMTELKKYMTEFRRKIKDLGEVHVNAIEEYKTVNDRYSFLTLQRDDLIEAEEKLRKVIHELNDQMVRQFKNKFKEITVKFNEVFNELFGGGKAMLELTDSQDVLEAGIDIIAQPPGKKLQSMRLLSGGERAFTAIALLFAIQALKPSPFCVLDEIEAALDDANVHRFANYLHKLTKNTQFIIITHRRGTMEVADALYGITMQEKGVSTQVSVKLLENELED